jgi:hypothetical protein
LKESKVEVANVSRQRDHWNSEIISMSSISKLAIAINDRGVRTINAVPIPFRDTRWTLNGAHLNIIVDDEALQNVSKAYAGDDEAGPADLHQYAQSNQDGGEEAHFVRLKVIGLTL